MTASRPRAVAACSTTRSSRSSCTRWVVGADGRASGRKRRLQLSGMYCAACSRHHRTTPAGVPGVRSRAWSAATERATVRWDPSRQARLSGLIAPCAAPAMTPCPMRPHPRASMRRREHRQALWRLFVASFCAMQVMMMATPSYVATGRRTGADMRQLLNWGSWVLSLPVMWFAAGPFFAAPGALRRARIGMDVPVALALGVTFVASMGATFDPVGRSARGVLRLADHVRQLPAGRRYLELRARHRAAEDLESSAGAHARDRRTAHRPTAAGSRQRARLRG
jgi:Cu2+-exporting ATPase